MLMAKIFRRKLYGEQYEYWTGSDWGTEDKAKEVKASCGSILIDMAYTFDGPGLSKLHVYGMDTYEKAIEKKESLASFDVN